MESEACYDLFRSQFGCSRCKGFKMETNDLTDLIGRVRQGDELAKELLFEALQSKMRTAAQALMLNERADHTLQPSALVNEAVIKLLGSNVFKNAEDRRYLFAASNKAMKDVLIDHARTRNAMKRPPKAKRSTLDMVLESLEAQERANIFDLTESLEQLKSSSPRQAEVIEHHYFSGLQYNEIAELMEISLATVKRDLILAKAKLYEMLNR